MAISAADIAPKAFGGLVADGGAHQDVEDDLQVRWLFYVPAVHCGCTCFSFLWVYTAQAQFNFQRFRPFVCTLAIRVLNVVKGGVKPRRKTPSSFVEPIFVVDF